MGLLIKILLIFFGIYFIGRAIFRAMLYWFIGDAAKKMDARLHRQKEEFLRQKKKQQGHITINYQPKKSKSFEKDDGDYVDFEEVK